MCLAIQTFIVLATPNKIFSSKISIHVCAVTYQISVAPCTYMKIYIKTVSNFKTTCFKNYQFLHFRRYSFDYIIYVYFVRLFDKSSVGNLTYIMTRFGYKIIILAVKKNESFSSVLSPQSFCCIKYQMRTVTYKISLHFLSKKFKDREKLYTDTKLVAVRCRFLFICGRYTTFINLT